VRDDLRAKLDEILAMYREEQARAAAAEHSATTAPARFRVARDEVIVPAMNDLKSLLTGVEARVESREASVAFFIDLPESTLPAPPVFKRGVSFTLRASQVVVEAGYGSSTSLGESLDTVRAPEVPWETVWRVPLHDVTRDLIDAILVWALDRVLLAARHGRNRRRGA
jgi:hypothetical protein